jgi:hypothetical protein
MKSRAKYLALWRRNNQHSEWLHARACVAKRLERTGGMVTILGVRVNWKVGAQ